MSFQVVEPDAIVERLRAHLATEALVREGGLTVLAVSGGPDSLALLDLLYRLAPEFSLSLLVAHADHGIAASSGEIAHHVAALARERYALETVVGALGLGPAASETRARTARYHFLRGVQSERGARYLLTAHHADDQIETVLLRVLRGSAPGGLAGIAARGRCGLRRPLLVFTRVALARHVAAQGLPAREDPANADPRHLRSWVRTVLRPTIEARLGEGSGEALLKLARHAALDTRAWDAALDALGDHEIEVGESRIAVARGVLREYDKALAAHILRAAARRAGLMLGPASAARLVAFARRAPSGRSLALAPGLVAAAEFDTVRLGRAREWIRGGSGGIGDRDGGAAAAPLSLAGEQGAAAFGRFRCDWRSEPAPAALVRGGWTSWFPPGDLEMRSAATGDRLVPLGGVGRRRVRRLLMEAKVPRGERGGYPVLAGGGAVLWVPGVCRADAGVPAPGTRAVRVDVVPG